MASKYPSWNPYTYTLNNPLNNIDPNGLWTDPINNPTYRGFYGAGKTRNWSPNKSEFGLVRNNNSTPHQGVDLTANSGTDLLAVESGKIIFAGERGKLGQTVMLEFKKDDKTKIATYSHMKEINVKEGDTVSEGNIIGTSGKSGNAEELPDDQAHVHFEIRTKKDAGKGLKNRENPADYMKIKVPEKPKDEKEEK